MHTDVERLIAMAKSTGFITPRQHEMILGKARALGDDIVEVEFYLDDIPVKEEPTPASNTQTYARPNQAYSAQTNQSPQNTTVEAKPEKKKKKKGKWIWIVLLIIVVGFVVFAVASIMSDKAAINRVNNYLNVETGSNSATDKAAINRVNNYYNNVNYTDWDSELTRFSNGWDSYFGELAMGRPMDEVDNEYIWLNVLTNTIENAYMTGQLTPEQQNRYEQIMNKVQNMTAGYALEAGAKYLLNQILN